MDLHLVLPGGTRDSEKDVYYAHKCEEYNGGICTLDHDAIPNYADENPQENIFWEKELPDGVYRVFVKPKSVIKISLCRTAKRNPLIFPI
mgnify:CR=1 FL=1